jgi:YbbR domain-containing protein
VAAVSRLFDSLFEHPVLMRVVALVVAIVLYFTTLPTWDQLITLQQSVPVRVTGLGSGLRATVSPAQVIVVLRTGTGIVQADKAYLYRAQVPADGAGPGVVRRSVQVLLPRPSQLIRVEPRAVKVRITRTTRKLPT